jgi:hypothetical protein
MRTILLSVLLLLPLFKHDASVASDCVTSIGDLKAVLGDRRDSLQWVETTMDDGKPLVVSIVEKKGALVLAFIKTGEGVWAEGSGAICRAGSDLEVRFDHEKIRFGPAANWVLRNLSGSGARFTLTPLDSERLRIATRGWSGVFAAKGN